MKMGCMIYTMTRVCDEVMQWNEWGDLKCLQKPTSNHVQIVAIKLPIV